MANTWFRFYSEFLHDPKVRVMTDTEQLRLVLLFCLRCGNDKPLKDEHIAFALRINIDDWKKTKSTFVDMGFLTNKNEISNWDKRQFLSDSSCDRVKKYRNNRKSLGLNSNGYTKHSETVMERDGNCCVYCGSQKNLCIDHILPTQLGGNDDIDNLATACKACNSGKAGRTPEQAGYSFLNKITEAIWDEWMSRRVTVTVTSPEQNRTDTEHISNTNVLLVTSDAVDCPHNEIIKIYSEILPELPQPRIWDGQRKKNLTARWKWVLSDLKKRNEECTKEAGIDFFRRMFIYISKSDLLMGRVGSWSTELGWIVKAENFAKIIQGNYENTKGKQ